MTSYGKCSRKRGSEGCHKIDAVGAQTLTDLWVWEHLQFEVCRSMKNNLRVDLGSIAGNLSFLTFLLCQLWLNGFFEQACLFFFWFLNLFSQYSTIWISLSCILLPYFWRFVFSATFSSSSGRASRCSRAVPELLTGLVVSSWLEMVVTKMSGGVLSEVTTLWTATLLCWWGS